MAYNTPKQTPKETTQKTAAESLETLLAVFPAAELERFYLDKSSQLLLLNAEDIEHHQAVKELFKVLKAYRQ